MDVAADCIAARFRLDYGGFRLAVDLRLPARGISVLFGDSGSGKTTLLRCIAGLERPPYGFLAIDGDIWQDSEHGVFLPAHRRPLGYVFQQANLFPHLSVMDNLQYGRRRVPKAIRTDSLEQVIDLLGIGHLLDRLPERLSGGERQRVAIARALAVNPRLLLMDEPLASLDEKRKQEFLPFLTRLHRELEIPVFYVTHSRDEMAQLADYLVLLAHGKEVVSGPLTETLTRLDAPPALDKQAASVWQVRVSGHEPEYHLTEVAFSGGTLSLPYLDAPCGTVVRIQIHARDVSLALQAPAASSVLNVLAARISGVVDAEEGQTVVKLHIGDETLLAHITRKSARLLGLETGMQVFAQVKGTSILN